MKDNNVKIIGGKWKRKNISFNEAKGLRPTLGKVRETLFNWLGQDLYNKNCLDLFAGTGAFSLALPQNNKFKCVFSNDIMIYSKEIYELNNPGHELTLQDLNKINVEDIPNHDLLCGGFPCQPFSIAGEQKGFDDKRSNVFWKIIEILEKHTPGIIILENVKNLKTHDKGKTYNIIENKLQQITTNYNKFDII